MNEGSSMFTEEKVSPDTIEYPVEDIGEEPAKDISSPVEDIGEEPLKGAAVSPEESPTGAGAETAKDPVASPRHTRKKEKSGQAGIFALILAVLLLGAACAYGYGVYYYTSCFLPGTYIDGVLVENLTPAEAQAKITAQSAAVDTRFAVTGKDGVTETVDLSPALLSRRYTGLETAIEEQDRLMFLPEKNESKFPKGSYTIAIGDPLAFKTAVLSMKMADPAQTSFPQDACVTFDDATETYSVVPEKEGTAIIPEVFVKEIRSALENGAHEIAFSAEDPEGVYQKPSILSGDEALCGYVTKMNSLKDIHARVDMGAGTVIEIPTAEIRAMLIKDLVTPEGAIPAENVSAAIDREKFEKYLSRLDGKYSTKPDGGIRYFYSITGKKELVHTDYGWDMDKDATGDALFAMLDEAVRKAVVDPDTAEQYPEHQVTAVWLQEAVSHETKNDVGNTWAEVDIANQMAYLVVDGETVVEAPVVTGLQASKGRRTPTGIYQITFKTTNRDLVGYNADGTENYRSHVNYWMPFNKNIGLHDATWRGSFGGNIYLNSGSHGCVNMPLAAAKKIYGYVYKGMPVIVYAGTKE